METATSQTDLARSTPICMLGTGLLLRVWPVAAFAPVARWCRSGEASIPSLERAKRGRVERLRVAPASLRRGGAPLSLRWPGSRLHVKRRALGANASPMDNSESISGFES